MKCPKCSSAMEKVIYEGIEVDRCTNCQGIWFDFQEQKQLKDKQGADSIDIGEATHDKPVSKMYCPRDGLLLTQMVDVRQPHIWYEACPHCYGVFFDAGEFRDYSHKTVIESVKDLFTHERK
jgi:uncharacterized protein